MDFKCTWESPLGPMILLSDGSSLRALWFAGQKYIDDKALAAAQEAPDRPELKRGVQWLRDYFAGRQPSPFSVSMAPQGSDFRMKVWRLLLNIPYGSVTSYGALAGEFEKAWGKRVSAQAIGGAVGHNPLSILIPCHRVLGSTGALTGYAGGLDKKEALLKLEGAR